MTDYVNINSQLYSTLFFEGGDNLISVYAHLKFGKNGAIKYYKKDKTSIYKTLKQSTNLSITTLKKYIKILQKERLVYFDTVGNFCVIGNNKINKLYKRKGRTKLVPIEIGKTFKETKLFSFRVRVFKMEQQQKNRIDRRYELNNIIERKKNNRFLSTSQFARFKAMREIDWEYYNSDNFEANTVLSNQGFSKLKGNNSGAYWKKQLVSAGIIKTQRNIKVVRKCTKAEYQLIKQLDRSYSYYNGKLYKEYPNKFTTTEFQVTEKPAKEENKKVKPLEYLAFDFHAFMANN